MIKPDTGRKNIFKKDNKFFETSKKLSERKSLLEKGYCGIILGYYKKGFKPTKYFLEKNKNKIKNYIIIKEKVEFLFTCGRDLFKESIIQEKGNGRLYVVFNKKKEVLGLSEKTKDVYKNILNIGLYLKEDSLKEIVF